MKQTSGLVRLALVALVSVAPTTESHAALIDLATKALDEIDRLNLELDDLSKRQGGRYLSVQECAELATILDKLDDWLDAEFVASDKFDRETVKRLLAVLSR